MAECLFIGGVWDGQRREVPDGETLVLVDSIDKGSYQLRSVLPDSTPFFVWGDLGFYDAMAVLLANYRPHTDWRTCPTCKQSWPFPTISSHMQCPSCRIGERVREAVAAERVGILHDCERLYNEGDFEASANIAFRLIAAAIRARGTPEPDAIVEK